MSRILRAFDVKIFILSDFFLWVIFVYANIFGDEFCSIRLLEEILENFVERKFVFFVFFLLYQRIY